MPPIQPMLAKSVKGIPDPAKHGLDKPALRLSVTYKETKPGDPAVTKTIAVGKVRDIFDCRGITEYSPAPPDDSAKVDAVLDALGQAARA